MLKKRIVTILTAFLVAIAGLAPTAVAVLPNTVMAKEASTITFAQNVKQSSDKAFTYYKYKAKKTGTLTLTWKGGDSGYIALCNNKKKVVSTNCASIKASDAFNQFSNKVSYGVVKGQTYYLRWSGYKVKAKIANTAVKDMSGKSRAKARTMSLGKSYVGLITANDKASKADWFKITLKPGSYYFCGYNTSKLGAFSMKIYDKNGRLVSIDRGYGVYFANGKGLKNNTIASTLVSNPKDYPSLNLPSKVTYYISIQRNADNSYKKGSGSYVIGVIKK